MIKQECIDLLIADFKKMFPSATKPEVQGLRIRLECFDLDELKLLVSQL